MQKANQTDKETKKQKLKPAYSHIIFKLKKPEWEKPTLHIEEQT